MQADKLRMHKQILNFHEFLRAGLKFSKIPIFFRELVHTISGRYQAYFYAIERRSCYFVFTTPHGRVKRRRKTSLFLPLASSSTAMTQWRRKMKSGRESFDLFTCVEPLVVRRSLSKIRAECWTLILVPLYIWQL